MAKMGCSPHALVPIASLRSCQQRSPMRRSEEAMSLRTKFFAMTYDRQIAGAEKAGLRAFLPPLPDAPARRRERRRDRDRRRDRAQPVLLRAGRQVADDYRARACDAAPPGARRP